MMTPDVNVVLLDFHKERGREMVVENEDGSFTIIINSRLSYNGQLNAYNHAIRHIKDNDFEKENVQEIEFAAHSASKPVEIPESAERIPSEKYLKRIKALQASRKKIQQKLQQLESELEIMRNMEGGDPWSIPSRLQWFGGG